VSVRILVQDYKSPRAAAMIYVTRVTGLTHRQTDSRTDRQLLTGYLLLTQPDELKVNTVQQRTTGVVLHTCYSIHKKTATH